MNAKITGSKNKATWVREGRKTSKTFLRRPRGEIRGAEVDEEIPLPVQHGEQVLHAPQVGLEQAGAAPDGHHPPGRGSYVGVLLGDLQDLPVQVGGALPRWTERSDDFTGCDAWLAAVTGSSKIK